MRRAGRDSRAARDDRPPDDAGQAPRPAVLFNLVTLNFCDRGEAYTISEHRGWLRDAGFDDVQVDWNTMPTGTSVVRARTW